MGEAAFWGLISASSLLVGAGVAFGFNLSRRWIGLIMGFGVGTLISAIAFELVVPAIEDSSVAITSVALLVGALTFFVGDWAIDHFGGEHRKSSEGEQGGGSGTSIVLGTVLDGIPESMVLGMTIASTAQSAWPCSQGSGSRTSRSHSERRWGSRSPDGRGRRSL